VWSCKQSTCKSKWLSFQILSISTWPVTPIKLLLFLKPLHASAVKQIELFDFSTSWILDFIFLFSSRMRLLSVQREQTFMRGARPCINARKLGCSTCETGDKESTMYLKISLSATFWDTEAVGLLLSTTWCSVVCTSLGRLAILSWGVNSRLSFFSFFWFLAAVLFVFRIWLH